MAANEGWYQQWFSNGWFPSVWFAPGDESHLLPEEVYVPSGPAPTWINENVRFTPVFDRDVAVGSYSATAGTSAVEVESRTITVVTPVGTGAYAGSSCLQVDVQTNCNVRPIPTGAESGYGWFGVTTSAAVRVAGYGARSGGSTVSASGEAEVSAHQGRAMSGTCGVLPCVVVKNPTDEELLWLFRHRNSLTAYV